MNYIDIIIGLILIFAAFNGLRKGLINELASLAALILGIWGAIEFSYITTDILTNSFNINSGNLNIISFIITFVVIVILINIIGSSLTKLIEVAMLGPLNKLTGLVFGILRSALILSVLLLVFDKIDKDIQIISQETKRESKLYEPVRRFAPSIFPFIRTWDNNGNPNKNDDTIFENLRDAIKT